MNVVPNYVTQNSGIEPSLLYGRSLRCPSLKLFLSLRIMLQCQAHFPRWWSLMQPLVSCILYSFDVLSQFALNSLVFVLLDAAKGRLPSRSTETFATAFVP